MQAGKAISTQLTRTSAVTYFNLSSLYEAYVLLAKLKVYCILQRVMQERLLLYASFAINRKYVNNWCNGSGLEIFSYNSRPTFENTRM